MYMHVNEGGSKSTPLNLLNSKSERYCLKANLHKACRVISSLYGEAMSQSDLQGTQFTLLSAISGFGEVTIGELSNFLIMDQTTVTRSVNLLKEAKYIEVMQGEDRRTRIIHLTERGQEALQTAYPMWLEAQTRVWEHLGNEKVAQLLELSNQIIAIGKQD